MGKSTKVKVPPKKRGGPRKGAGRKPGEELKKAVTIYVKESSIERHGGELFLKEILSKVAEGELWPIPAGESMTQAQKNQEKKEILKRANPITEDQAIALHNAENKDQMTQVFPMRQIHNGEIMAQIAAIRAEKIPKDRDTVMGRKSWELDQRKRIEELQNQLK